MTSKKEKHIQQKYGLNRRQYLTLLSASTATLLEADPVWKIFKAMVHGLVGEAHAQTVGIQSYPSSLFFFAHYGGFTAWDRLTALKTAPQYTINQNNSSFDSLRTNEYTGLGFSYSSTFTPAQHHARNANCDLTFHQHNYTNDGQARQMLLPAIWRRNIPLASGGNAPMTDMLTNSIIFNGVNFSEDEGHVVGTRRVLMPDPSFPSVSGIIADRVAAINDALAEGVVGQYQIPALAIRSIQGSTEFGTGYRSEKGTPIHLANSTESCSTWFHKVLEAFRINGVSVTDLNRKRQMQTYIDAAMRELKNLYQASHPGAVRLYQNLKSTEELFERTFGDLQQQWDEYYNKYYTIAQRCHNESVNRVIPPQAGNGDFSHYATEFAIAEFIAKNNLVAAATFMSGRGWRTAIGYSPYDEHRAGDRQISLINSACQIRTYTASLREFSQAIGQEKWEKSLTVLAAEYGRNSRFYDTTSTDPDDVGGSDHSTSSSSIMVSGGAIKQHLNIGNIRTGVGTNRGAHCQGRPSVMQLSNGTVAPKQITNHDVAATISHIAGVESPTRAEVLVEESGQTGYRSLVEHPKTLD